MSTTAHSDWDIRIQFSQVEGFRHQCFATAHKGATKEICTVSGVHSTIPAIRLVTPWVSGRLAAESRIQEIIAAHEEGRG